MKKICFFSGNINRAGGTEHLAAVIANELCEKNFSVYIVSLTYGETSFFELSPNIHLYSLHMEGKSSNFSNISIIKKLRSILKEQSIDYLIDIDIILSFYSIPASMGTSTKVISWESFHYFVNVGDITQRIKRTIARNLASRFSEYIVTQTVRDKDQYQENLHSKAKIIAITNPLTIKHNKQANLDSKIVLAVGRLNPQKGFDLLLQAWKIVSSNRPEWKLRIIGSGQDENKLKQLAVSLSISNMTEFIPKTKKLEQYYINSSVYVMSSRFEGFGLVLVEAKSFGLPIVSFDCDCGPSDIVRDEIDGILVEKENIEKLAAGILELIDNHEKRRLFGKNALEDNRFDIENIISQWQKILVK